MGEAVVLGSLSIFDRVFLGLDEGGEPVNVVLAERNLLVGGEPGAGKSVALNLIVAHAALSLDCRLVLVDGKRVELGVWKQCADTFVGPSIDNVGGNVVLGWTGTDAQNRLNALRSINGTNFFGKRTFGDTSSFGPTVSAMQSSPVIAWTGKDNAQSLNVMRI